MGLSSSQARLLHLTSRMHQIEYKAAKLEAEKLRMANESQKAYDEYLNALESTKVQYKFLQQDGSIGYNDASYYSLCMYGGGASDQFALLNPDTDEIYLTQTVKNAYEQSADASDFALRMSGLTEVPTPPNPTPTPVNPNPNPNPNPGVVQQDEVSESGKCSLSQNLLTQASWVHFPHPKGIKTSYSSGLPQDYIL